MIEIREFDNFPDRTFGLGQDVAQSLMSEVEVASLFMQKSKTYKNMLDHRLHEQTVEAGGGQSLFESLTSALVNQQMTYKNLVSVGGNDGTPGRQPYATGLIRALIHGQKNPAITDWAAMNYLSVTIGLGLLDFDYNHDEFTITDLGEKAVRLFDSDTEESRQQLDNFMLERLYEYPYAAWLIRVLNDEKWGWGHTFTKFELGSEFGFIDEAGFTSLPEEAYIDQIAYAKATGNREDEKKTKSNFESTSDKYMRWLTGVLAGFGLLTKTRKTVKSSPINGKTYEISLPAYKATGACITALNFVNGGSSHKRSKKRVRWEYLAPKSQDASKRKTIRALELKFLSESPDGLPYTELADKINQVIPELKASAVLIVDDVKGLNRIGIEIHADEDRCKLIDKLYDFIIPVKKNHTFDETEGELLKERIRPFLTHVDHRYLKGIDIAFKPKTSNAENTELEQLSTELFTKEMQYSGRHLGGSSKPDGIAYTHDCVWVIDSKAYHNGFTLDKKKTDPMSRYIREYRMHIGSVDWWAEIPENIPEANSFFMYVSGSFTGNYRAQLKDFENFTKMRGSLMEIAKLILLAEKYRRHEINKDEVNDLALDGNITFEEYFPLLTKGW